MTLSAFSTILSAVILVAAMVFTPVPAENMPAVNLPGTGPAQPDRPAAEAADLVGVWYNAGEGIRIQFCEDGSCYNDRGFSGTYTVDGDALTIKADGGYYQYYTFSIDDGTMTLHDLEYDYSFSVTRE